MQSHPEAIKYARELLHNATCKEGGGLLSASLDTQLAVRLPSVIITIQNRLLCLQLGD